MSDKQTIAPVFENVRKQLEPLHMAPLVISKKKCVATSLVPYENYVGSILGGQFRLGHVIREEEDGDVYAISDLNAAVGNIEAKAFILRDISQTDFEARKRNINKLSRRRICSIDQAGRKFIVYRCLCPQVKSESMLQVSGQASKAKENQQSMTRSKSFQSSAYDQGSKGKRRKRQRKKHQGQAEQQEARKRENSPAEADDKMLLINEGSKSPRNIALLPDKLASMTPANQITERQGRKRLRKRGKRKLSIPEFASIFDLNSFWAKQRTKAIQTAQLLFLTNSEDSPKHGSHPKAVKKYKKQAERRARAVGAQLEDLERRREQAISLLKLASELRRDLEQYSKELNAYDDLLACDMYESLWMLRKNPPIASRYNPYPVASALQQVYGVYSWADLADFNCCWRRKLRECVNGRGNVREILCRRFQRSSWL